MPSRNSHRWRWVAIAAGLVVLLGSAGVIVVTSLRAADKDPSQLTPNDVPTDVGIEPKLGAQLPLDVQLYDESGEVVRLGEVANGKPVLLTLVYYRCPMLCNMTMDGQVRSLTELSLDAGKDYTAVTVSFDPRETPALAAAAKKTALTRYGRDGADQGWRFLTGEEQEIRRLTDAVGFRYRYDEARGQYAHGAGLVVLTPEGVVSRYLYGVEFPRHDLRLALVEASNGTIGTAVDGILLLCYHYDPTTGKYGLAIMNVLRLAGVVTLLVLGGGIFAMLRHERSTRSDGTSQATTHAFG